MSVIVFAPPQPELAMQQAEVSAVVNAFYRPLLAYTEAELRQVIRQAAEGFWFCGHSSAAGIVADGQTLSPAVLGQYLSVAGVDWSFLNSCESNMFIDQLQRIYPHDCYANITEVTDATAWRNAALVAATYADVGDIHEAVALAVPPGDTPLRFFPSPSGLVVAKGNMPNRGSFNREDSADSNRLPDQIGKLTEAIYELRNQIAMLNRDLTAHDKRLERLESTSDSRQAVDGNNNRLMLGVLVAIAVMMAIFLIAASTGLLR